RRFAASRLGLLMIRVALAGAKRRLVSFDDDWSRDSNGGDSSSGPISESEGGIHDDQSNSGFYDRGGGLDDVLQLRLHNNRDFDGEQQLQKECGCLLQREQL
ncbi:hypothetical protein THAOC_28813, partial [Thalassiosira oceanica]